MASSSHHQGDDHLKYINSPCFYKIILQDDINNGKLGIPPMFVKNHGHRISSPAMLRVPSGEVWKVELTKCDGTIWLQKGWPQFSSHYSLDFGHFLVFRYDGNSNFHVTIFNRRTATEIQYPHTSRKVSEKSQSPSPRPRKMTRSTNSPITMETECNGNNAFVAQQGCATRKDDKSTSHDTIRTKEHEKVKVVERDGNSFKSENQSFIVVMRPTHVGQNHGNVYRLVIPFDFAKKHLTKEHCSVTLCCGGKTWIANIKQARIRNRLQPYIQAGWDTFVQDNSIQLGDVCSFKLINSIQLSFKVVIQKGQHEKEPLTDLKKAGASKSEDPFFVVVLKPSYVNYYRLSIPADFARQYFTKMHKEVIFLLLNGKSWPVRYHQHSVSIEGPKPNVVFSEGWRRFSVDNNLEVGDVCRFELTKGAETSMNVTITKKQAVEDAKFGSSSRMMKVGRSKVNAMKRLR